MPLEGIFVLWTGNKYNVILYTDNTANTHTTQTHLKLTNLL